MDTKWIRETFGTEKPIVAMCHIRALPGDPGYDAEGGMERVVELARQDMINLRFRRFHLNLYVFWKLRP